MASNSSPPVDAFPVDVVEAFDNVDYMVRDLLEDFQFGDGDIMRMLDENLVGAGPIESRIRFLCRLTSGYKGLKGFLVVCSYFNSYVPEFTTWLSLRLTETLCAYAGNARIRAWRQDIANEWEGARGTSRQASKEPSVDILLRFAFSVLIPRIASPLPKRLDDITEQVRHSMPKAMSQPKRNVTSALPQALDALCEPPLTVHDVRTLLIELGVLSEETGYWHLGELSGKAAKPKSAFPAAYRALVEAKLMRRVDAPVWRKLFEDEFQVSFSDRLANYAWSRVTSAEFDIYHLDASRWVTKWRVRE